MPSLSENKIYEHATTSNIDRFSYFPDLSKVHPLRGRLSLYLRGREPRSLVTKLSPVSFISPGRDRVRIPLLTRLLSPGRGRAERCVSIYPIAGVSKVRMRVRVSRFPPPRSSCLSNKTLARLSRSCPADSTIRLLHASFEFREKIPLRDKRGTPQFLSVVDQRFFFSV